jgi:hypothetical protein
MLTVLRRVSSRVVSAAQPHGVCRDSFACDVNVDIVDHIVVDHIVVVASAVVSIACCGDASLCLCAASLLWCCRSCVDRV